MYIKSIVIDGFKSYGQRTEVNGFDSQFNAITGLNGSGKSNILDSICFLLGITNLTQVRATNLQELVYKNGQAGISKATVSITFCNIDKKCSPIGYESYDEIVITRQVVIGGKNKYLINGINIQNNRINDLFRSIQLNINNPHFLIMQGRITKVLNMKPPEILSMLEEASGTRMYESKKQNAQKTIEKKDAKLKEIESILNEEINPTLNTLRKERTTYLEFQNVQRSLEHYTKFTIAYKFIKAQELDSKSYDIMKDIQNNINKATESISLGNRNIQNVEDKIIQLRTNKKEELTEKLNILEEEHKELQKNIVKSDSAIKALIDNKKREEKKKKDINIGLETDKKVLEEKKKINGGLMGVYDALRTESENAEEALRNAEARYEAISLGKFSGDDGSATTLQEQIIKNKENVSHASTYIQTSNMKLKHNSSELKKLMKEMKTTEAEYARDSKDLSKYESEFEKAKVNLERLNFSEQSLEEVEEKLKLLKTEVGSMRSEVGGLSSRIPWLDFKYRDPEPGFDRSAVRGVAANLFRVKNTKHCVALDTCAGGKLKNVIVNNSIAAGKILKNGKLVNRTVMLPLDKITGSSISLEVLKRSQNIVGKDNVFRAIDLIEYEPSLTKAMEHIFGNCLIVKDLDQAEKLAYHREVNKVCVTLEGDIVKPSGDMSGGSANKGGSILSQIKSYKELTNKFKIKNEELSELTENYKKLYENQRQYKSLKSIHDQKEHELKMIQQRLEQTSHRQVAREIEELTKSCEELEQKIKDSKKTVIDGNNKIEDLEYKVKHASELKEKELKDSEAEVKACRKAEATAKSKWSKKEAEEASLKMEIVELENGIIQANEQDKASGEIIQEILKELKATEESADRLQEDLKKSKDLIKLHKDSVNANNKEIQKELAKKESIIKENSEKELALQQLKLDCKKAGEDAKEAAKTVQYMLQKYEWIEEDKKCFGQPDTVYDFKANDPAEAQRKLVALEEKKEKLSKTVNMRAMKMLGKAEEQYNDLMKKKKTVENDKSKIYKVIEELDIKKKAELRSAWAQVNDTFGKIFSSLLPGSLAKLQPPEGQDVLDGLEVKVGFGDKWKESLAELSGGQRSLVALSLILSLLKFNPAPLYILDEVDAALDLSHTQNIGNMLKKYFKDSQFIVVSLKDGMFNNANVLFRTKFVDGMSTVTRTTQSKK